MEIFKFSYRHRFLNIWLIAIACQNGQLLAQVEDNYNHTIDYFSKSNYDRQPPEGISSEQVHAIIYPEDSSSYSIPESFYSSLNPHDNLEPHDGQRPFLTNHEWSSEEATSYSPITEWHSSPTQPVNGQWPASSRNHWGEESTDQNSYDRHEQGSAERTLSISSEYQAPPISSDFRSSSYSKQSGTGQQNLVIFDPDLKEAPDREQHPLTKEGEAKSYPFETPIPKEKKMVEASSIIALPVQQLSSETEKQQDSKKIEKKETEQATQTLSSLTEGKGNVKFIKKRPESVPPTQRLQEALNQPEEVIGKTIINDSAIGMVEISESSKSTEATHLDSPPEQQTKETAQATPRLPSVITPTTPAPDSTTTAQPASGKVLKEISINFNNVAMVEYIRFISRISNKNFIFDDEDLQFSVTIISEEPTTIENLMTALLQELRIRDLSLIEQGNNIIIHRNPRVRSPARIVSDENKMTSSYESELVTRVFRLNTLDPLKASEIIRPLISEDALIEVLRDTNNLIITDLVANVNKISQLINTLDAPNSGVTIGQYVLRNAFVDSLVDLANKILQPIAQGNPFVLVPHTVSNSIYIVSNSFIVEKALAILQNLDVNEGRTKILSLENLQPAYDSLQSNSLSTSSSGNIPGSAGTFPGGVGSVNPASIFLPGAPAGGILPAGGASEFSPGGVSGNGYGLGGGYSSGGTPGGAGYGPAGQFPNQESVPNSFPFGGLSAEGHLNFPQPGGPASAFNSGGIGTEGRPSAIFDENRSFAPGGVGRSSRWTNDLPVGHIERTLFFIYKLRYRKGDSIEIALRKIANSLQLMSGANSDLISAINSSQWIESSNALVFTGTSAALEKVRELILEVDVPLRQVFIEMLILVTSVQDSLTYSVDWINRFGGGTSTGEEGFINSAPGTGIVSTDNFLSKSETILSSGAVIPPGAASPLPVATGFMNSGGFVAGVIGTHLTHNGTHFSSLGALVRAIHTDTKAEIVLNPKIVTEDNNPAEIFVGSTDRYKTQSITNDLGSLVTNNFQFIDVGTTLRVTPLIGNNGIITLEIVQETTSESPTANTGGNNQDVNLVEVLTKTRTVTKIHVPNGFFVILSGMIQDNQIRSYSRIPCLGGIPIVGCFGKSQTNSENKRNLMLFIRPLIIDTDEDYEDITRRQQDIHREKSKFRRSWNYEVDEALNFGNIKSTDPDDMNCMFNDRQHR